MAKTTLDTLEERLRRILEAYIGDVNNHTFIQVKGSSLTLNDLRFIHEKLKEENDETFEDIKSSSE